MGLPRLKQAGYTLEDWKSWEGRWELMDGVAYDMTPAPSTMHQKISTALVSRIFMALEEAKKKSGEGRCSAFHAPTDVFLGENVVQPNILVVCDPAKISPRGIEGPPDLVVEILSPSTVIKDMNQKRDFYETAGIKEYLIVDPVSMAAVLLRLEGNRYQTAAEFEWGAVMSLLGGKLEVGLG